MHRCRCGLALVIRRCTYGRKDAGNVVAKDALPMNVDKQEAALRSVLSSKQDQKNSTTASKQFQHCFQTADFISRLRSYLICASCSSMLFLRANTPHIRVCTTMLLGFHG
jgi:hypothetical protein